MMGLLVVEVWSGPLVEMKRDFSIDKKTASSKDSLEIIKYIVVK